MKAIILLLVITAVAHAFQSVKIPRVRIQPLYENFGLDFATDPDIGAKQILGEANLQNLVRKTNPDGLLVRKYDIIKRTRDLKLLSVLADSGLIQALEQKGLTLSKIEKLLPLVDELNLLEFAVKNKQLVLSLAPLLIEPAPALLPLLISVLKTSPATFSSSGFALLAFGGYEFFGDNGLLGITAVLLGLPLTIAGSLLNSLNFQNLPEPKLTTTPVTPAAPVQSNRPIAGKKPSTSVQAVKVATPLQAVAAPIVKKAAPAAVVKVAAKATGSTVSANGSTTRRRKTVKVN